MTEAATVTVVIPQFNRADLLDDLLKQLCSQTHPICRTIVVDNGSTDDSVAVARRHGADVIALTTNRGFAYAVNRGIEACATTWIAILNNDITIPADWLMRMLAGAGDADFAVGKLLTPGTSTIDGTFDLVCQGATAWRCGAGRPDDGTWSAQRQIQFAPLTAALFRREVFDKAGLLDERFESYLEDVDLGLRCSAAGLRGVYVPDAVGTHQGSATRGAWHKATVRQISRNQLFIVFKHFRGGPGWKILVAQLLWGFLALRHGAGWCVVGR